MCAFERLYLLTCVILVAFIAEDTGGKKANITKRVYNSTQISFNTSMNFAFRVIFVRKNCVFLQTHGHMEVALK